MGPSIRVQFSPGSKGCRQRQVCNLMLFLSNSHHHVKDGKQFQRAVIPPLSPLQLCSSHRLAYWVRGFSELTMCEPSLGSKDSHKDKGGNGSPQVPHPPGREAQLAWGFLLTALCPTGLPWYLYVRRIRKSQGSTQNAVPAYLILITLALKGGTRVKTQQEVEDQECKRKWAQRSRWARKTGKTKGLWERKEPLTPKSFEE